MQICKNIVLKQVNEKPILIDTFYSEDKKNQPIVVFCHGYKGFKDWGAWHKMAEQIADRGNCVITFNFSYNGGTIENPIDFPDLEAFGNNNYTKELNDLSTVIDWAEQYFEEKTSVNTSNICVIGHSRGGGIAILKASEDSRINKLITLASVSDFSTRFGNNTEIENWKTSGVKYVLNGRTKQQMPHYYQFYEDFLANEKRLHIESALKKIQIPMLIIHGEKDTSVLLDEAKALYNWYPKAEFKIIKNADHVFNTIHPWDKDELSTELKVVVNSVTEFISETKF